MLPTMEDISGPSDWPASFPELRNIDNLLRCSICKEYFNIAVLIQDCSHNYCSLCIRQSITNKTHCPTCSVKISSNDLKCNRVIDQLVKNFIKVRSKLLELTKTGCISEINKNEVSDDSDIDFMKTPKGKNYVLSKRKLSKGKSPRVTPRNKRKRQRIIESDSDADYDPVNVSIKQEPTHTKKAESDKPLKHKSPGNTSKSQAPCTSSFVECPGCGEMTDYKIINSHLDTCLTRQRKKSSLRSSKTTSDIKTEESPEASTMGTSASVSSLISPPTSSPSSSSSPPSKVKSSVTGSNAFISNKPKRKAIPGIVCNLLKDKELKQKLKEWNLSTQGDRQTLIKRYQEFVTTYNAQCDSNNPKSASLIVKEIEIRENQKRSKKFAGTSTDSALLPLNKDSSTEEVEKAREITLQQHGDQFAELIKNIKMRRKTAESTGTQRKPSTVSQIVIDNEDSNQGTKEIVELETMKEDDEVSSPTGIQIKALRTDSISMNTKPSGDLSAMLTDPDKPDFSISIDDETTDHLGDNGEFVEDVVMEYSEEEEALTSPEAKTRVDNVQESEDQQRPTVPEPPSPSSLVLNENDDGKGDIVLDSSPSLGLASSGEEDNDKNNSDSDEELFRPSFERPPIKVKSSRTRKR